MHELQRLHAVYRSLGAELATDGIPLHFGDLRKEYTAAENAAILLDRSHEGRLQLTGRDRLDLLDRISTNDVATLAVGTARSTLFTNANARIIDRVVVFVPDEAAALLLAGPGRGGPLADYLKRNVFYNDAVELQDQLPLTHQFALHGPTAGKIITRWLPQAEVLPVLAGMVVDLAGVPTTVVRLKPFLGTHWVVIVPKSAAVQTWESLLDAGAADGLQPAGGLTYNTLRIRGGQPGVGHELTADFIPLELGLWDEVSFSKGCYTGQEIIARMESRKRLARMLVRLDLESFAPAPVELYHEGKRAGLITSSVVAPDEKIYAMGVVRTALVEDGAIFQIRSADGPKARLLDVLGTQPSHLVGADDR